MFLRQWRKQGRFTMLEIVFDNIRKHSLRPCHQNNVSSSPLWVSCSRAMSTRSRQPRLQKNVDLCVSTTVFAASLALCPHDCSYIRSCDEQSVHLLFYLSLCLFLYFPLSVVARPPRRRKRQSAFGRISKEPMQIRLMHSVRRARPHIHITYYVLPHNETCSKNTQ